MIPRNKFVRIFQRERRYLCIVCDDFVISGTQKSCPDFVSRHLHTCLCKYNHGRILYDIKTYKLFDNTSDEIISTILECNGKKYDCKGNCTICNFTTSKKEYEQKQT